MQLFHSRHNYSKYAVVSFMTRQAFAHSQKNFSLH